MHEYLLQQSIDRTVLANVFGVMGIVTSVVLGTLGAGALAALGRKLFKKKKDSKEDTPIKREKERRKAAKKAGKTRKNDKGEIQTATQRETPQSQ